MTGTKFDKDKLPLDLLPETALEEVAKVLEFGAKKYQRYNWAKGIVFSRLYAAARRHLSAWQQGQDLDPETGISHVAHAAANMLFILHFIKTNQKQLDDRPVDVYRVLDGPNNSVTSNMHSGEQSK